MLTIMENEPKEKEIKDAIEHLTKMLSGAKEENLLYKISDEVGEKMVELNKISEIHKGRLDRQGRDIFVLWNKVANLEKQVFRIISKE